MKEMKDPVRRLEEIMKRLRSPEGCPWDREQTHRSLMPCLMEECAEFLDAVSEDDDAGMCEELGDILMHVVLNSVMAEEREAFTLDDVASGVAEKMIRRHPHVFGSDRVSASEEVVGLWEKVKQAEKGASRHSVLDGVPRHCPALLQAEKLQRKAAKFGFDWSREEQILEKIEEELAELRAAYAEQQSQERIDEEIGDLLFAVCNLTRFRRRSSGELLLAEASAKFERRFRFIEDALKKSGRSLEEASLEEMDNLWNQAKASEGSTTSPSS